MSVIRRNVVANILGRGSTALFGLVFVPFYINLLGSEAYGVIGLFVTLQALVLLADLGLSGAFTREAARLSVGGGDRQRLGDIARTFEVLFVLLGAGAALALMGASPWIAAHWVRVEHLSAGDVRDALLLMAVAVGLQLPFAVYQAGLLGLQQQGILNGILIAAGFMRGAGAIVLLTYWSRTIECFFYWQVFVVIVQVCVARVYFWRRLGLPAGQARVRPSAIFPLWRFARDMAAIGVSSAILTQMDKLVLSKMLPLSTFGYYSLASVIAGVPVLLAMPFHNALYPRFTQLVEAGDTSALTDLYHTGCQTLAVLLFPVAATVALFSKPLLMLWTHNPAVADNTAMLVTILVVGSAFLGSVAIPYALQLAYRWTKLPLYVNVVAVCVLFPSLVALASKYGAPGAAAVWVVLNAGYVLISVQIMHRRILVSEKWRWYRDDFAKPLAIAAGIAGLSRLAAGADLSEWQWFVWIGATFMAALVGAVAGLQRTRRRALDMIVLWKEAYGPSGR